MKRGGLRWDEAAFAEHSRRRGRFAVATFTGPGADAGVSPAPSPTDAAPKPTHSLVALCRAHRLPEPVPEFRFHASRKWRADYCWPEPQYRLIVEIDGGIWTGGRHSGGAGQLRDMEKLNAAALLGFRVLRYTPQQMAECMRDLREVLRNHRKE